METTKEPIVAAGLLDKLADMFFKGIGNALDAAAEYEEEMGVLKQVNRIPIHSKEDKDKSYVLTIKLSPIKNKDSYYYVEAETNAPGLDAAPLNQKTMRIENHNMKQFKNMIDSFLSKHNVDADFPDEDPDNYAEPEVVGEEAIDEENPENSDNGGIQLEGDVDALVQETQQYYKDEPPFTSKDSLGMLQLDVQLTDYSDVVSCKVEITGIGTFDQAEKELVPTEEFEIETVDANGNVKDFNHFNGDIAQCIQEYVANNGLDKNIRHGVVNGSTLLEVSFYRPKSKRDVEVRKLNASTSIESAINIIYDLVEDDSFVDSLEEDKEQSFNISDDGENYDIQPIDDIEDVDIEGTYQNIFNQVSNLHSKMQAYYWFIGSANWNNDPILDSCRYQIGAFQDTVAFWIIKHTNSYPSVRDPFDGQFPDFTEFKKGDKIDLDLLKATFINDIESVLSVLDLYYGNLNHEEQTEADGFINEMDRILAYS